MHRCTQCSNSVHLEQTMKLTASITLTDAATLTFITGSQVSSDDDKFLAYYNEWSRWTNWTELYHHESRQPRYKQWKVNIISTLSVYN